MPALQESALPPSVNKCAGAGRQPIISLRAINAPSGRLAPNDLPMMIPSGTISKCSMENHFPVRWNACCTSSAIKRMPCFLQRSYSFFIKILCPTTSPASPCIGSMMTAATSSGGRYVENAISIALTHSFSQVSSSIEAS